MIADNTRMTAPCGLPCANCDLHRACEDKGLSLLLEYAYHLYDVPNKGVSCEGCREKKGTISFPPSITGPCIIYRCCSEKGVGFCQDCEEFPCDKHHPEAGNFHYYQLTGRQVVKLCLLMYMDFRFAKMLRLEEWFAEGPNNAFKERCLTERYWPKATITHHYPPGARDNPFDPAAHGKYFLFGAGFSYLFDDLEQYAANQHGWFNSDFLNEFGGKSWTVSLNERLVIIEKGEIVKEKREDEADFLRKCLGKGRYSQGYRIYASRNVEPSRDGFQATRDRGHSFGSYTWPSLDEARSHALSRSKESKKRTRISPLELRYIVCRVIDHIDFH